MVVSLMQRASHASMNDCVSEATSADRAVFAAMGSERERQQNSIELIASENFVSQAVLEAQRSLLTNKYAEGYPRRRYYGGCANVDVIEDLALDRVRQLFDGACANVQPHSGSRANQAVFLALLSPGDIILGSDFRSGGRMTHGSPIDMSGRWSRAIGYGVDGDTQLINMDEVEQLARQHRLTLIIAGGSAYLRARDFKCFREIADAVGAILMVDMAHFAGLFAGSAFPSPVPYADVVTSATHKTLRGPRGGIILTNDADIAKKINSAVFPGLQGGPLHVIAAKAVCFGEALQPTLAPHRQAAMPQVQGSQPRVRVMFILRCRGTFW